MSVRAGVLLGAVVALLAGLFVGGRALLDADRAPGRAAAVAPSFEAVTLDVPPRARTLADYRGDVVLLNIWATWCAPCRIEMPSIQALHERFADSGLKVVAVSIDHPQAGDAIREFAEALGLTFEILHDTTGAITTGYRTSGVPETIVIGRDGTVRRRVAGAEHWDSAANQALIRRLVRERPPRRG